MRILGISTAKRAANLPEVPTFREQGYDVVIDGWYVFVGPKHMTAAQIAYWDDIFARTVRTDEWKKFIDSTGWEAGYKNSQQTVDYLRKEYAEAKAILTELGLAK
jgi:tripartite-type tricarboxylate transporter receptor subunit TctC